MLGIGPNNPIYNPPLLNIDLGLIAYYVNLLKKVPCHINNLQLT